jgi:hypothetical protein
MDKGMNVSYEIICKCGRKLSDLDVAGGICPCCHRVVDNNVRKVVVKNTEVVKHQRIVKNQSVDAPQCVVATQSQKGLSPDAIAWIVSFFFYLMNPLLGIILWLRYCWPIITEEEKTRNTEKRR